MEIFSPDKMPGGFRFNVCWLENDKYKPWFRQDRMKEWHHARGLSDSAKREDSDADRQW